MEVLSAATATLIVAEGLNFTDSSFGRGYASEKGHQSKRWRGIFRSPFCSPELEPCFDDEGARYHQLLTGDCYQVHRMDAFHSPELQAQPYGTHARTAAPYSSVQCCAVGSSCAASVGRDLRLHGAHPGPCAHHKDSCGSVGAGMAQASPDLPTVEPSIATST